MSDNKVFAHVPILNRIMLPLVYRNDVGALRSFALTMLIAFPFVFMLVLPWLFSHSIPHWPTYVSAFLLTAYVIKPTLLYYPYLAWMVLASILGFLNTYLILFVLYVFMIAPIGVLMRLLGKLQYQTSIKHSSDAKVQSNWVKREQQPTKENLKEPF